MLLKLCVEVRKRTNVLRGYFCKMEEVSALLRVISFMSRPMHCRLLVTIFEWKDGGMQAEYTRHVLSCGCEGHTQEAVL